MKRILIIGAKGMLGRDLLRVLQSSFKGVELIGWDVEEIDIRQEAHTCSKIAGLAPSLIIHLAAYTDVDGCEKNREEAFLVNAEGTRHVALGAAEVGAKVVYLSTDYIFDGKKGRPYLETDLPNPLNVYGQSKWRGEQYLQEQVQNSLIIRTQWLYGRHGKNFISAILDQARVKESLQVVDDQVGSPTYTVDLSTAIEALVRLDCHGIFHATNGGTCSWYELARTIMEFSGIRHVRVSPCSSRALLRSAIRPGYSALDTEKLKRETGLVPRHWREALKEYLQANPDLIFLQERS